MADSKVAFKHIQGRQLGNQMCQGDLAEIFVVSLEFRNIPVNRSMVQLTINVGQGKQIHFSRPNQQVYFDRNPSLFYWPHNVGM